MFYLKLSIDVVKDTSMLIGAINGGVVNLRKKISFLVHGVYMKKNLKIISRD